MEPNLYDGFFSAAIVIAVTYALTLYTAKRVSTGPVRATVLFIWHTAFSVLYAAYTLTTVADAKMYFREGAACTAALSPGTDFVIVFSCAVQSVLGQYYLPLSLVSGFVGGVGLIVFDAALRMAAQNSSQFTRMLAKFIPFLPSVSFWSAGLGKDSFAFLGAALFCLAMFNVRHRFALAVLSILIMGSVRPHIAALQFAALILTYVSNAQVSLLKRGMVVATSLTIALTALPYLQKYVGLGGGISMEALQGYIGERQGYNLEGGGSVEISTQHPLERIFTLIFRPTILDARNAQYLVTGVENALLALMFFLALFGFFKLRRPLAPQFWVTGATYSLLGILVLSQTVANLGIASRQKWMVILPLIVIAIAIGAARSAMRESDSFRARPIEGLKA